MTENKTKKPKVAIVGGGRSGGKTLSTQIALLEELEAYRAIGTPTQIYEKIGGLNVELGKYHSIGTIEEFKALKEKSEPKKAEFDNEDGWERYICPNCGKTVGEHQNYCWNCGQAFEC